MIRILNLFLLISMCFSQTLRIGTNSAELSEYESEAFESGILYGFGIEFNILDYPVDIEIYYSQSNFLNENNSTLELMQIPISTRLYLKELFFLRVGIQYDKPIMLKILNQDFTKFAEKGFSLIYGVGAHLQLAGEKNIFLEGRFIAPQNKFLTIDDDGKFGELNQFQILFGYEF